MLEYFRDLELESGLYPIHVIATITSTLGAFFLCAKVWMKLGALASLGTCVGLLLLLAMVGGWLDGALESKSEGYGYFCALGMPCHIVGLLLLLAVAIIVVPLGDAFTSLGRMSRKDDTK